MPPPDPQRGAGGYSRASRFCTVHASSPERARDGGARELGLAPQDLAAEEIGPGTYRVVQVRAPSTITVDFTHDKIEALLSVTPPLGDAPAPTRQDVLETLKAHGVGTGILLEEVDALLADVTERGINKTNVTVARGRRPVSGTRAVVHRHYVQSTDDAPEPRYRIVREGAVLIEVEPATAGEPGCTVDGAVLPAPHGQQPPIKTGGGLMESGDRCRWTAAVPGIGYLELDADGNPTVRPAVSISADHMHAYLTLLAPLADEAPVTRDEVEAAIRRAGVTHGLLPDRVDAAWQAFQEHGDLPRPIRIADGTPPTRGRDGGVEYAIDISKAAGRVEESSEQIDYREQGSVHNVRAGDLIGVWRRAEPGIPGTGVDGASLPAEPGQENAFALEENVTSEEQEDGTLALRATIDGVVVVRHGSVISVVDLITVPGDVDYGTGNIDATGSVLIQGTVRSGFRVTATKDITVQECTEEAHIQAGETLVVKQGIIGGDTGCVSAGRSVTAKYAQQAHIRCGGDVEIHDFDTNSVIECAGVLRAIRGHGRLMGGRYTTGGGVEVKVLGSDMGTPTIVAVGFNPELAREIGELEAKRADLQARIEKIDGVAGQDPVKMIRSGLSRAQAQVLRKLLELRRALSTAVKETAARLAELRAQAVVGTPATVKVFEKVYEGVELHIRGRPYHTTQALRACVFHLDQESGEVRVDAA